MSDTVKVAVISGLFALAGAVVANACQFTGILRSLGIHPATHVVQVSESQPEPSLCDDAADLGRIVIHSSSDGKRGIFFCPQGPKPNYESPRSWYVARGI